MSLQMRAARSGPAQGQQFLGSLAGWAAGKVGGWVSDTFGGGGNGNGMPMPNSGPGVGAQQPQMVPASSGPTGSVRGIYPVSGPKPPGGGSYCPNKSAYWRTGPNGGPIYIEKGTIWVRRRRRNSLNNSALSRAIARVDGAKKLTKKLGRITIRKPKSC